MSHQKPKLSVVLKVCQTAFGTDYLFRSFDDLLSVGVTHKVGSGYRSKARISQTDLAAGIEEINGIVRSGLGASDGLIYLSEEEVRAVSEALARDTVFRPLSWTAFHRHDEARDMLEQVAEDVPMVHVARSCAKWIPGECGWDAFRAFVKDPEGHGGHRIGEGSEGIVYRTEWAGRACALKVVNWEADERFKKLSRERPMGHFTPHFRTPSFIRRAGFLPQVLDVVRDIPNLPFDMTGVRDYAFGHSFHLMEHVPDAMSLSDLLPKKGTRSETAQAFMDDSGIAEGRLRQVSETLKSLDEILNLVREAGRLADGPRHDMDLGNLLVRGTDPVTGRLQLTLIDQGQEPGSFSDPNGILDDAYAHEEYKAAAGTLDRLRQDPAYGQFLSKHLPNGLPAKTFYM